MVRDFIGGGGLSKWAANKPEVAVEVLVRNGKHPFAEGSYRTQASSHQVSIKNSPNWRDIEDVLDMLRNRSGRKIKKLTTPVLSDTPSIQGVWTPFLNLHQEPAFKVTVVEGPAKR